MVYLFLEGLKSLFLCPTDEFVLSVPSCWQLQTQLMPLLKIVQLAQGHFLDVKSSKSMDNNFPRSLAE